MKTIVKMLGLKFPGGFDRQLLSKGGAEVNCSTFRVEAPSPALSPRGAEKERSPVSVGRKRSRTASSDAVTSSGKKSRQSQSPSKMSATDRMNLHVSMTLELKDSPAGTTIACKMPSCGAQLSLEQLASHFLAHETSANVEVSPVSFPCAACGVTFKSRPELDSHTKLTHGASSLRDKLDLLSDSSDDDEEDQMSVTLKPTEKVVEETVKCNTCFKTFRTNKAHQVHLRDYHKGKTSSNLIISESGNEKESPTSKRFGCQICTKRFNEMRELKTHYTLYHFWEDLSRDYKHFKDVCKICMIKYPTEDHLIQHMGNFHCMIDKYLVKKGLRVVSKEKTAKLLSWRCEICKVNQASSSALKSHLSVKHYQRQLLAEHPIGRGKVKKCPKCFKMFEQSSVSTVVAHIGSYHDEVIKYAAHHLDLEAADVENIPLDDFDDGTIGIPVDPEEENSKPPSANKVRKAIGKSQKGVFDYLQCQICLEELASSFSLKIHYIRHFEKDFQKNYFSTKCPHCEKISEDIFSNQRHVALEHDDLSLIPFMEARGLWVDKSLILEEGEAKLKRNDVLIKKLDQEEIRHHLQDIEKSKSETVKSHICEFPDCGRTFGSEEHFLIHLATIHFWKELCQEYGESFRDNSKRCIICSEEMDPKMEKTGYFKHLAVAHKVVLKYVEKTKQERSKKGPGPGGIKIKLIKMSNRMEAPSVETFGVVEEGNGENNVNVENDSNIPDSQANVVIKSEAVVEQAATTSRTNRDLLLSKIRNIFSDDSDSE